MSIPVQYVVRCNGFLKQHQQRIARELVNCLYRNIAFGISLQLLTIPVRQIFGRHGRSIHHRTVSRIPKNHGIRSRRPYNGLCCRYRVQGSLQRLNQHHGSCSMCPSLNLIILTRVVEFIVVYMGVILTGTSLKVTESAKVGSQSDVRLTQTFTQFEQNLKYQTVRKQHSAVCSGISSRIISFSET